jgi:hypothetical protein
VVRNGDKSFRHRRVPEMVRGTRNGAIFLLQFWNRYGNSIETRLIRKT